MFDWVPNTPLVIIHEEANYISNDINYLNDARRLIKKLSKGTKFLLYQ